MNRDNLLDVTGDGHQIYVHPSAVLKGPIEVSGHGHTVSIAAGAVCGGDGSTSIRISGRSNSLDVGPDCVLGLTLRIDGERCSATFGAGAFLFGRANVLGSQAHLRVGHKTTMVEGSLQLHEPGQIVIGDDCMISRDVFVSLSDMHPIYDRTTGERLNTARSVTIGDHVWLGLRSMILKGAQIGAGSVVGAGTIVTQSIPENVLVAGAPAKTIREDVVWRREFETDWQVSS